MAHAVNTKCNHGGPQLRGLFSSDTAHWDVPDMTETLAEAYGLGEDRLLTTDNFRDFTFNNAVRMQGLNPDFLKGTVIEAEAAEVLANDAAAAKKD